MDTDHNPEHKEFENPKNVSFDSNGNYLEISIKLTTAGRSTNRGDAWKKHIVCKKTDNHLEISLPKILLFKEFLNNNGSLDRLLCSGDGRVITCGRIVLHMNES